MATNGLLIRRDRTKQRAGAYIGFQGYATILATIKTQAMTVPAIASITGVNESKLRRLMKEFLALRLVHREGWHKPTRGCHLPMYRQGDGDDAPIPMTPKGKPQPYHDFKPSLAPRVVAFGSLVQVLASGPVSKSTLMQQSGISMSRISELLAHMRKPEIRLVNIAAWERRRDGCGPPTALFKLNPDAKDAQRLKPIGRQVCDIARRDIRRGKWGLTVAALKRHAGFELAKVA